jgi:transposase InsO family protein
LGTEVAVPWKEQRPLEQRFEFVLAVEKGEQSMAALCRQFGITRQTGYKWWRRYLEDPSPEALVERSRRPMSSPQQIDDEIADGVVLARKRFPHWGPRTLRVWLQAHHPEYAWPSAATIGRLLKRRGLVVPRRRRRRTPPYTQPFAKVTAANQLWCIDFKGHFCTGDGVRLYPLTITDSFSRFILRCEVVQDPRCAEVREIVEDCFDEFGLPEAIRSDNGPPFASTGPGALTELSAWWIALGIRHERIDPGKPQQNARHERMHLTLKRETASPPAATARGQQGRFDRWRKLFNEQRPHQGIDYATPASLYAPSAKRLPAKLDHDYYRFAFEHVLVDRRGFTLWNNRRVFIGRALRDHLVEFRHIKRRRWLVCFGPVQLGIFDQRSRKRSLLPVPARKVRAANGGADAHSAFSADGRQTARPQKSPRRLTPPLSRRSRTRAAKKAAKVSTMS